MSVQSVAEPPNPCTSTAGSRPARAGRHPAYVHRRGTGLHVLARPHREDVAAHLSSSIGSSRRLTAASTARTTACRTSSRTTEAPESRSVARAGEHRDDHQGGAVQARDRHLQVLDLEPGPCVDDRLHGAQGRDGNGPVHTRHGRRALGGSLVDSTLEPELHGRNHTEAGGQHLHPTRMVGRPGRAMCTCGRCGVRTAVNGDGGAAASAGRTSGSSPSSRGQPGCLPPPARGPGRCPLPD